MAKPIKCVVCKGTHPTINDVKFCHMQNKAFVEDTKAPAKVQTKVQTEKVRHEPVPVQTFSTKEEAEEFVSNNPGSRLSGTTKVKHINVFNKETMKYETKVEKTYTVIL